MLKNNYLRDFYMILTTLLSGIQYSNHVHIMKLFTGEISTTTLKKEKLAKLRGKITKPVDTARTVNSKVRNFNIDRNYL